MLWFLKKFHRIKFFLGATWILNKSTKKTPAWIGLTKEQKNKSRRHWQWQWLMTSWIDNLPSPRGTIAKTCANELEEWHVVFVKKYTDLGITHFRMKPTMCNWGLKVSTRIKWSNVMFSTCNKCFSNNSFSEEEIWRRSTKSSHSVTKAQMRGIKGESPRIDRKLF